MKYKRGYYDMFVRTCAKWPSNIAVRYYNEGKYECYTYSELYGVCEYISQNLQQLQCTRGIIGVISNRNFVIPCVVAASHKCCTAFMFLDPSKDINTVIAHTKLQSIVTIGLHDENFELSNKKPDKSVTIFDTKINFYTMENLKSHSSVYLMERSFIAMTSGSTGEPKRIQVPIQCIQPNVDDLTKLFHITSDDIIYFSTPLTFDPSMIELLLACENGASLLIAPEEINILFPENKSKSITFWQTTPSKFFQVPNTVVKNRILCENSNLKILAFGGEPLIGTKRLRELKCKGNQTKLYTLYGVTEMSCWACIAELDLEKHHHDNDIPLGNCLSETEMHVQPSQDDNNLGNIILVSKTRKCAILNTTLSDETSINYVDTGDLGEVKNGTIYYRGRRDDIIKRFGVKVNIQTVEVTVMQCPKINACSCIWLPKTLLLVVYFSSNYIDSEELAEFLKSKLDPTSWPDKIIRVQHLPLNEHGKKARQILIQLYESSLHNMDSIESFKVNFIKELKESLNTNLSYNEMKDKEFFSLGGTSFLAVALCNRLSLQYPEISRFILMYLLSRKNTIGKIMRIVHKEYPLQTTTSKTKMKRSMSVESSLDSSSQKRSSQDLKVSFTITELWFYNTGKCVDASPTLYECKRNMYVTVGSHSGRLVSIEAFTGKVKGMLVMNSRLEASVFCYHDVTGEAFGVVGTYNGTIICFALVNCKEIWRINIESMIKSKATCHNGLLYVAAYDGIVRCINVKTGYIEKQITITNQGISADLVLANNYVLTATLSGVCAGIFTQKNAVIWRDTLNSPVFASPAVYNNGKNVVFAEVKSGIHCYNVEKGVKLWKYDGAKGNIFSSLCIKKTGKCRWQMIFGCHDNKVYCVDISNNKSNLDWIFDMNAPVYATPCTINNGYIIAISTKGTLAIINSDNGSLVHEYLFPGEIFSSPAVYGNHIFVGCRNDNLFALKYKINT